MNAEDAKGSPVPTFHRGLISSAVGPQIEGTEEPFGPLVQLHVQSEPDTRI
ncbi:hypothetical protein IHN63_00705 [Deinococcus sp. 6YEL10]|uniref:hypothetical protein n=1 Tax=Deinococcus sp. 6YEL10 TaxID=2745870 RepID=UPI001E4FB5C8|nr:hypothetical protein [Deinococcus sp. 6YEL10]MCD0159818.1 hypothetical protein [Deinococcus sp. 6YEL10]